MPPRPPTSWQVQLSPVFFFSFSFFLPVSGHVTDMLQLCAKVKAVFWWDCLVVSALSSGAFGSIASMQQQPPFYFISNLARV